jgi:hypothetical protein
MRCCAAVRFVPHAHRLLLVRCRQRRVCLVERWSGVPTAAIKQRKLISGWYIELHVLVWVCFNDVVPRTSLRCWSVSLWELNANNAWDVTRAARELRRAHSWYRYCACRRVRADGHDDRRCRAVGGGRVDSNGDERLRLCCVWRVQHDHKPIG